MGNGQEATALESPSSPPLSQGLHLGWEEWREEGSRLE